MRRLIIALTGCWFSLMFLVSVGHAYYHLGEKMEKLSFQKERIYAQWGEGEKSFVIYDNFTTVLGKFHQDPVISPRSDNFVPADVISSNLPIRIAIRYPLTVESSLSNLLYANLKLKRLLEDYRALQQRSRELLAGLTAPDGTGSPAFLKQPWKEISVYRQREQLEMEYHSMQKNVGSSSPSRWSSDLSMLVSTDSLVLLLSQSKNLEGTPFPLLVHSGGEGNKKKVAENSPDYYYGVKVRSAYSEKPSLPWIFKEIFSAFKYLLSHMFETFIFGVILFLFILGIWLLRPR